MKLYYFTDNKSAEQKATHTIESIEVDTAAFQADSFIVADRLSAMGKRWYGPYYHEDTIKSIIDSIDTSQVHSLLDSQFFWGLNMNTMKFDFLDNPEDFDGEVYVLYPNAEDLLHFQQLRPS